ncbi:MAG TPA: alpha/beta fold hydrolase [Steroidobacteraceae bacterium]
MSTAVVYVHGLWLSGLEGGLLRRRLARQLDAETHAFTYASVKSSVSTNAESLGKFLNALRTDTLHLVGHSLGGLVILKLFEQGAADRFPPGRIVFLGSPLNGSRAALNLARLPLGKTLLGRGVHEELLTLRERHWQGQRDLGVIAGSLSVGLGKLVGARGAPNDGTIFVDETRLAGILQHLVMPVSHTGLPFSKSVARQAGAFLGSGKFID